MHIIMKYVAEKTEERIKMSGKVHPIDINKKNVDGLDDSAINASSPAIDG